LYCCSILLSEFITSNSNEILPSSYSSSVLKPAFLRMRIPDGVLLAPFYLHRFFILVLNDSSLSLKLCKLAWCQSFDVQQFGFRPYSYSLKDSSSEVGFSEVGSSEVGFSEVGSSEVGSSEVGFHEVGSSEVGFAEVGNAEGSCAEVGFSEVGSTKDSSEEFGKAEIGSTEVGSTEIGKREVGFAEVGFAEVG
jgi:hypothetical protein